MMHPGLPFIWAVPVFGSMLIASIWAFLAIDSDPLPKVSRTAMMPRSRHFSGTWVPIVLIVVKVAMVAVFLVLVAAGLFGTPMAGRNAATVVTWNIWWLGLVFAVFFLGSLWCAVCPWDAIAHGLVRRRLWRRAASDTSLGLRLPRALNNIWPAFALLVGLTWLELGAGITVDPYGTAVLALVMVVLATVSGAIFQRKAFCRAACPVGRTVGMYSQLSPVALRPIDPTVCAACTTLECYHGSESVDSCPTGLVMGRITQNSACLSCGNCVRSCPTHNVGWQLRSPAAELAHSAKPRWDEAWFMVGLLAVTVFHGMTMLPQWSGAMSALARAIGDSGQLLLSFTAGLVLCLGIVVGLYGLSVVATKRLLGARVSFKRVFSLLAFAALPLAFAYHLAHNLNHLSRETGSVGMVISDPFGSAPMETESAPAHAPGHGASSMLLSPGLLHAIQAGLMIAGLALAVRVVVTRGMSLVGESHSRLGAVDLLPVIAFVCLVTGANLWMLMQPMAMRM